MRNKESLNLKGVLTVTVVRGNGDVEVMTKGNIIVKSGFDFICDCIASGTRPNVMGYIGVGTGVTSPVDTQTTLVTELARKAVTYAHTVGTKVFTVSSTFNPGEATGAITESGVFNASSAGIMLDRVVFAVINKGVDDTVTMQFQFTLS